MICPGCKQDVEGYSLPVHNDRINPHKKEIMCNLCRFKFNKEESPDHMNDTKQDDESELGMKFDGAGKDKNEEKLQWSLLPIKPVEDIIRILMFGAKKYTPGNWMHVKPRIRYYDALQRHLTAWLEGEQLDPETNESHLSHAGCCLLFLMWGERNRKDEDLYTGEKKSLVAILETKR